MMKISIFACFIVIWVNPDHHGVTARKPQMTPSVEEILIQEGDDLTLSCQGEGRLHFSKPHYKQTQIRRSNSTGSFDEGSKMYTFILSNAESEDTGWYACAEENISIFNNELNIYHPGEEISWIYVYVNSSRPFSANLDEIHLIRRWSGSRIIIPCRITSPNLQVILVLESNGIGQVEEAYHNPKIGFITNRFRDDGSYSYRCQVDGADEENVYQRINYLIEGLNDPIIYGYPTYRRVLWGEDLTLECNVHVPSGTEIHMNWTVPNSVPPERLNHTEPSLRRYDYTPDDDYWDTTLTIRNISKTDEGKYICVALDGNGNRITSSEEIETWDGKTVDIKFRLMIENTDSSYLEEFDIFPDPNHKFINVTVYGGTKISTYENRDSVRWDMVIDSYPDIDKLYWYKPNGIRIDDTETNYLKYTYWHHGTGHTFKISDLIIEDSGNYTINVSTSHHWRSIRLQLTVLKSKPKVSIEYIRPYFTPHQSAEIVCVTQSKYLPNVTWSIEEYPDFPSKENIVYRSPLLTADVPNFDNIRMQNIPKERMDELDSDADSKPYQYQFSLTSRLNITINMASDVVCLSCNAGGCTVTSRQILVSDIGKRFGIVAPHTATKGDDVNITCGASVYYFTDKIWWDGLYGAIDSILLDTGEITGYSTSNNTKFTYQIVLHLHDVDSSWQKIYECKALINNNHVETARHKLIIKEPLPPQFTGLSANNSGMIIDPEPNKTKTVLLECLADGWPIPEVTWWKNDEKLIGSDRYKLSRDNSVLEIENVSNSDGGRYTCYATNRFGEVQKYTEIRIAEAKTNITVWPIVSIAVVSFLIVIVWMSYRKRREIAARRRFMEATLQHFNAGALDCLDPELNMAEQAELLPYNKKWEFPRELLKFGKELGSGSFGVVRMAEAKSICVSEAVTTVAVKVVRSTANLNHMTALQRELKVLTYLGKHLNVVNLLGACTKHVSYGQLFVIVEFCRFGNLRDYLLRHRADFVGQGADVTQDINAGFSHSEDFHTPNDNDVSRVSCDNSSASAVFHRGTDSTDQSSPVDDHVSEPDSPEQARRIDYQGDYGDEDLEPISTRDLLSWAWQVARGMKFLGLRRILHGDLAARNILLADHGVVKICDFGLAKTLFTDDNYQQKGNDPLPYKWMAIESLKDRIFSVHSDVWSYGVVLWEFYSLAKTPYSGIRPATLCEKLAEGFRMARPEHATTEIYQIMLHCWNAEPHQRPSFAKLIEDIGRLMEDSVKTQYLDLDASYVRISADASENEEPDFLSMKPSEVILIPKEQTQA